MVDKFSVKRSCRDGHVCIRVSMTARGWYGDNLKIEGGSDLTSAEARDLAAVLLQAADRVDAKAAAKKAADERRRKWRDREIKAGRIKVIGLSEFAKPTGIL